MMDCVGKGAREGKILFLLHGYESLIGHCAFDWADVGAAADAGSFEEKLSLKQEGNFFAEMRDGAIQESEHRTKKQVRHFI